MLSCISPRLFLYNNDCLRLTLPPLIKSDRCRIFTVADHWLRPLRDHLRFARLNEWFKWQLLLAAVFGHCQCVFAVNRASFCHSSRFFFKNRRSRTIWLILHPKLGCLLVVDWDRLSTGLLAFLRCKLLVTEHIWWLKRQTSILRLLVMVRECDCPLNLRWGKCD